jgi:NAD(P)-dependent dehydrogenase (short-subunit alcohol dehydrogenase family)
MALELAEHGITVNAVAPGEIATTMTGAEDEDPHDEPRGRSRPAAPGTPVRSAP